MVTQYARQTAVPCTLEEIRSGAWVQNDGLVPSGVRTARGMIARASVIGVIIEKRGDAAFVMDDGTSIINVRSFDTTPVPVHANVGDMVLMIGRPREYQNDRYMVLEICKKLRNPAWAQYRKRELSARLRIDDVQLVAAAEAHTPPINDGSHTIAIPIEATMGVIAETDDAAGIPNAATEKLNPFERLIAKIRELDVGGGADVEDVLSALEMEGGDKYLRTLIEEGEIFETRPGKVKVLE